MDERLNPIGRLLEVASWDARDQYRGGGRGKETPLTAEVFTSLDYLPRTPFLLAVLARARCSRPDNRLDLENEIEEAEICIFPPAHPLNPKGQSHQERIEVQPDARIVTPSTFLLIEAKRLKSHSFQLEQVARTLLVAARDSGGRVPKVLLVLAKPPPIPVKGQGRLCVEDAFEAGASAAIDRAHGLGVTRDELSRMVSTSIHWITWSDICLGLREALIECRTGNASVDAALERTVGRVEESIEWHG